MPSPEAIRSTLGYLNARNAVNEAAAHTSPQNDPRIYMGNPKQIRKGILVAEVSSPSLTRSIAILATRPPFRDKTEARVMDEETTDYAHDLACVASGITEAVLEVGACLGNGIDDVIVSKSGALAVMYSEGVKYLTDRELEVIEALDGGNYCAIFSAHPTIRG